MFVILLLCVRIWLVVECIGVILWIDESVKQRRKQRSRVAREVQCRNANDEYEGYF